VFLVMAMRLKTLMALKQHALTLASELPQLVHKVWRRLRGHLGDPTSSTDRLIHVITTRLRRRRRSIANCVAALMVFVHIGQLVQISVIEGSICTTHDTHPRFRGFLASIHIANIWIASAFLVIPHRLTWNSTRPDLAFVFAILVLELSREALNAEQSLLAESRLLRQVLLRCLLGASVTPMVALAANLLYTAGLFTMFRVCIPDGTIFTVGKARAVFVSQQNCVHTWDHTEVLRLRNSTLTDLATETSFREFATLDIAVVVIIMVGLLLFDFLSSEDIVKSLRLQSSENHLLAVSQILDRLCDATCQLSPAYSICTPAPKLDVLLHMSPTPGSMVGTTFCSLLSSERDWASIERSFDEAVKQGGSFGEAQYVDLKSASNNKVRVQLLSARFVDCAGEHRILCGFTELHSDPGHADADGADDVMGQSCPGAAHSSSPRRVHSATRSQSGSSSSSSSSSSRVGRRRRRDGEGSGSRSAGRWLEGVGREDCALDIEVAALRICWASRHFENFVGVRFDASKRPCARGLFPEPEEVRARLQQAMEDIGRDEFEAPRERRMWITLKRFSVEGDQCLGTAFRALFAVRLVSAFGPDAEPAKCVRLHMVAAQRGQQPDVSMLESL